MKARSPPTGPQQPTAPAASADEEKPSATAELSVVLLPAGRAAGQAGGIGGFLARLLPGGAGMQMKVAVPPREAGGMIAMVRDVSVAVGWAAAAAVTVAVAVPAGMSAAGIAALLAAELAGFITLGAVTRIRRRPRS